MYDVQVTVTDAGGLTDVQDIAVTVTDVNEPPVITSDGGGATATVNAAENQTTVTDVQTSDPESSEGSGLTYSLTTMASGGVDNSFFTLNTSTGVLTFTAARDFENPQDDGGNGVYDAQVTVTDAGGLTDVQDIAVTVTDVNDAPVINLDDNNNGGNEPDFDATFNTGTGTPVTIVDTSLSLMDQDAGATITSATVTLTNIQDANVEILNATASGDADTIGFVAGTGVLTITASGGTASIADFQAALRSVTYDNNAGTPTLAPDRIVNFVVNDGTDNSAVVTSTVTLISGPTLDLDDNNSSGATGNDFDGAFTEDGGAVAAADTDVTIVSPTTNLVSATVTLTNRPDGDANEVLAANASGGIVTGDITYTAATGVLAISPGTPQSVADFEAVLESITYNNIDQGPNTADRIINVVVTDTNAAPSSAATSTISVTGQNDPPAITSSATPSVAENQTSVIDVESSDPDGTPEGAGGLTYSLTSTGSGPGIDNSLFSIVANTGVLTFQSAPDFENAGDNGGDNVYNVQVTVTDPTGLTDAQNISVTVTDVNEAPTINNTANASDLFVLDNGDESILRITPLGVVSVFANEAAILAAGGGSDVGFGGTSPTGIAVDAMGNVFFASNSSSTEDIYRVTSGGTVSLLADEAALIAVTGNTDVSLQGLTVGSNGNVFVADSSSNSSILEINATTGAVSTFRTEATIAAATGVSSIDLDYIVGAPGGTFFAVSGGSPDTVFQLESDGSQSVLFSGSPLVIPTFITRNSNGDVYTTDIGSNDAIFEITSGGAASTFVDTASLEALNGNSEVTVTGIAGDGLDNLFVAETVGEQIFRFDSNGMNGRIFIAESTIQAVTGSGPDLSAGIAFNPLRTTLAIDAAENQTAIIDLQSSDDDGDTEGSGLTYSISGGADQSRFSIVAATGVLTFSSAPDFENPLDNDTNNIFDVQVTVTDSGGLTDVLNIAVTVVNVNESPSITSSATPSVPENTTAVIDVQSSDLDGTTEGANGLTYSLTSTGSGPGIDNALFSIVANTGVLTFNAPPDFENAADNGFDNVYNVQVTVTDPGGLTDVQDISVTVTDANDAPILNLDDNNNGGNEPNFSMNFDTGSGTPVTIVDTSLSLMDQDAGATVTSATVTLTNIQDANVEILAATTSGAADQINYVAATGVLTITASGGTATISDFQTVLRSVTYDNNAGTPTSAPDRIVNFVVNDGTDNSAIVTSTVTLISGPTLDLDDNNSSASGDDFAGAFTEDGGAVAAADTDVTIVSQTANLTSATATLTNRPDGDANEVLAATASGGIVAGDITYTAATGVLSISPGVPQSIADFEAVLESLTYNNLDQDPDAANRIINVVVTDTNALSSATAVSTISVTAQNDPPTANNDSFSISEDAPFTAVNNVITGGGAVSGAVVDTDPEGDTLTVSMADGGGPVSSTIAFTFNFEDVDMSTGVGFDDPTLGAARRAALQSAATLFASKFNQTANIEFDVTSFNNPGSSTLASAGSQFVSSGGSDFREVVRNKILSNGVTDENGADSDGSIDVNFGANFELSADPTDIDNTEFDFFSVVAHELAHAFGFASTINEDGTSVFGDNLRYGTFDRLITDNAGTLVINGGFNQVLWDAESVGGFSPDGGLFFNGTIAVATNGGNRVGLFTPTTFDDGSSVSHLDDEDPLTRGLLELAETDTGPAARSLSPLECAIFQDLGYNVFTTGNVGGVFNQDGLEISLDANGDLSVFPNDRFNPLDDGDTQNVSFDYVINDGNSGTDTGTVTFTITGANDAPFTRNDSFTVNEDSGATTVTSPGILNNDVDVDTGDALTVSAARAAGADLFFSEYVEGTAANSAALGIFNPTGADVFARDYEIRIYADGSPTVTTAIQLDTGNIGVFANQEFVVARTGSNFGVSFTVSRFDANLAFDGDDTIELFNTATGTSLDVIGIIDTDPGTEFSDGGNTTRDTILFRNPDIFSGNPAGFVPLSNLGNDWTADTNLANIDFLNHAAGVLTLGSATNAGGALVTVSADGSVVFDTNGAFESLGTGQTQDASIIYTASDGTDTTDGTATVTVTGINDAPTAFDFTGANAFNTFRNVALEVGGATVAGNLASVTDASTLEDGASDPDSPSSGFTVTAETKTTTLGGTVQIFTDGSFTYTPQVSDTGTDTFTYTLNDGNSGNDTGNVEVILDSDIVWFIDSDAGTGGDGTSSNPFDSLADVTGSTGPDAAGEIIFLDSGADYTGGITLLDNQTLHGEGSALTLDLGSGNVATTIAAAGTDPVLTNSNADAISLATGNTIRGLAVGDTGSGAAIDGNGFGTLTIDNVDISGTGSILDLTTGTAASGSTFDNLITTNNPGTGIILNTVGGSFTVGGNTMIQQGTLGIDIDSTPASAAFDFGQTSISNGTDRGIDIQTSNATASFTFDSLSITNDNGTGLLANSGGTVNIGGTASTINATGGAALDVTGTTIDNGAAAGTSWTFDSLSSTNSTGRGIDLDTVTGDITISNQTNVVNSAGRSIFIGGSGGTFSFGDLDASTSASNTTAVFVQGISGTTVNSTSGTISSAAGRGVNIEDAAAGITFDSIASTGSGTQGINLDTVTGTFTVTGTTAIDGATGRSFEVTGGSAAMNLGTLNIDNRGSRGVSVNGGSSTLTVTSATINNQNAVNLFGIRGFNMTGGGFTFTSATVDQNGGGADAIALANSPNATFTFTTVDIDDSGVDGIDVNNAGTVSILGGTIDGITEEGILAANTNLTVSGITFGGSTAITRDGIDVDNTANSILAFNNNTFSNVVQAGITVNRTGGTTTVTSLSGNIVSNAGTGGMSFDTVTFDSDTTNGSTLDAVAGGNTRIGNSLDTTNVNGNGISLNNALGELSFSDLDIFNDNGTGISVTNSGTVGSASGTINTTNGAGVNISSSTSGFTFDSVSSTNSTSQGINLDTVSGSFTASAGSITGADLADVDINAATANFAFGGTITNTEGRSVEVTGSGATGGGSSITFSGAIDDDGTGIFLENNDANDGATITFSGGLALDTGSSTAFNATGGGTVNVTGTNTIGAGTAVTTTGLNVSDTTIGSSGLTFESIRTNGVPATNLVNTGSANGLTITAGSAANDVYVGGSGPDILRGGPGADTLTGNGGANRFDLAAGEGGATNADADTFTDFVDGTDLIGLRGGLTFTQLTIDDDGGGNARISITAGGEILAILTGVAPGNINAADFSAVPLHASSGQGFDGTRHTHLSDLQLALIVDEATSRWTPTGLTDEQLNRLNSAFFVITDLEDGVIGTTYDLGIEIDVDAAGHGWFVDATPSDAVEFDTITANTEAVATTGDAFGHIDLLTAVMHELGHVIGLSHADAPALLANSLPTGTRRFVSENITFLVTGSSQPQQLTTSPTPAPAPPAAITPATGNIPTDIPTLTGMARPVAAVSVSPDDSDNMRSIGTTHLNLPPIDNEPPAIETTEQPDPLDATFRLFSSTVNFVLFDSDGEPARGTLLPPTNDSERNDAPETPAINTESRDADANRDAGQGQDATDPSKQIGTATPATSKSENVNSQQQSIRSVPTQRFEIEETEFADVNSIFAALADPADKTWNQIQR